jgi:hypothetical protein
LPFQLKKNFKKKKKNKKNWVPWSDSCAGFQLIGVDSETLELTLETRYPHNIGSHAMTLENIYDEQTV